MRRLNMKIRSAVSRLIPVAVVAMALLFAASARAAVPGIKGPSFALTASDGLTTQPDGAMIYSWGYGCTASTPVVLGPVTGLSCLGMQIPGPTLIVNEGDTVTVTLTNNLPKGAGNTSLLFPGFQVCLGVISAAGVCGPPAIGNGVAGLLAQEAAPGGSVTYTFVASTPGTHSYYSGTQADLQIEMGLYGALVVLPKATVTCTKNANSGDAFTLASSAYDTLASCYDREYLFQFAEMDPKIHRQVETQVQAIASCGAAATCPTSLTVATEPYHPAYFLINGRSMPDDMDSNFAPPYPHQPYNGNPHMHPGDQVLLRVIGVGRWQHPFHEHGNHVRILGRDGNIILSQSDPTKLAGPLLFTTTTTPGVAFDGIFYWSGRGLNWDVYGHKPADATCIPDVNGYYTQASNPPAPLNAPNYYEWCADHGKGLEKAPFGTVAGGGPATLPDPLILTNGLWYGGSPYLGPVATANAAGPTPLPPSASPENPSAGFAFMWHSHNEREITTNDAFPGGMMMMMIVDAPYIKINELL